ncbi:MAG TPA: hypothetical protein VGO83_00655, partial [Thermoleophilaceae bacterium]|nr:hypothetical protein [Thermoleophilaceae bacterium]
MAAIAALGAPPALAAALPGPVVAFDSGPGQTRDTTPTFSFSASDPLASFECALDGAAAEPCSSPHTTDPLEDGVHSLEVRATGSDANPGEWAARDFSVDTTPPETILVSAPPAQTSERAPRLEFAAGEAGVTFECSLDASTFAPCGSPWSPGELDAGRHLVAVRALDALGNRDGSPAVAVFSVQSSPVSASSPATVTAGVRRLAEALAQNLDGVARTLSTSEIPTLLGSGNLSVAGMRALVPGTLTVTVAPAGGGPAVIAGTLTAGAGTTGALTLRPTDAGRRLLQRANSVPVVLTARFTSRGLSMSSNRRVRLVRDWLT